MTKVNVKFDDSSLQRAIKNQMKNEVPSFYEVQEDMEIKKEEYESKDIVKNIGIDIDLAKMAKIWLSVILLISVLMLGLFLRTPLPKLDQELIKATDNLKGLEKLSVEYASGINAKTMQASALIKESIILEEKKEATKVKIGEINIKIENIIKAKSVSK